MGGKLIVIQDVQQVRAIGQKVDEQGEENGEGEEFHDKHLARLNNIGQAPLLRQDFDPTSHPKVGHLSTPLDTLGLP
jgi:hypothetical protein